MSGAPTDVLDSSAAGSLIIRGGALRFASYIAVVALSVISAALLTRYLGVARFGHYTTVISLVTVVSVVTDAGMSSLGTREFAVREGAERETLMRDLLGLRVVLTLLGVVLATLFAALAGYDLALLAGTVVAGLATVALVLQHTLSIPLSAELRLGALSLLDLARQALTVLALVLLIVLHAGLFPLLAVTLVVYLLLMPASIALARGRISLRMDLRPRRWASLLRLTVAFSLATAVGTIYVYTTQILMSLVSNEHQSGLFAASFRVYIVTATVPGLLVSGALPLLARAARDDRERLSYALQRIFEVSLILGVATAIGLLAGAQFIVHVIAGPQFAGAAAVLRIQGIAMIASFLIAGWGFGLISTKRYGSLLVVNALAFAVSCALTLTLAPSHGARGAALATVCGEAVLAGALLIALVRSQPLFRPQLAILPKVALAAAPAVAIALLATGLSSLARALLALTAYALIVAATHAVPEEITEFIPRPLLHRRAPRG
ncbi:MAG TPA: oligosaccharide flippase family protein [Solirubrobacteraceae bacterium]|jgi:O-antigen/teichoic acid export membrane protein|nr:oligosaccharide flippase family protein [Solirubrobacteraceae bacterium]